jgi:polar amino acid transport system substrate-binding protein
MKLMRARTLIVLSAALAVALIYGCGEQGAKPSSSGDPSKQGSAADSGDLLASIKKAGVIKWGADDSGGAPFVYDDPKDPDKVIGFEVDVMEKLAAHMGVKQELVKLKWESHIQNLTRKSCDIVVNGWEITDERKKSVSFSTPYYVYEQQITVRAADKDKYKSLDDLKDKKIGTLGGAEAENVLKRAGFKEDQIVSHEDSMTPYKNLEIGRVDAVLQEALIADFYAGPSSMYKDKLFNVSKTFAPGKYGVMVRPEDKTLLAEVDKALDVMKKNGELAEIYKKWNIWNATQKEIGIEEKK